MVEVDAIALQFDLASDLRTSFSLEKGNKENKARLSEGNRNQNGHCHRGWKLGQVLRNAIKLGVWSNRVLVGHKSVNSDSFPFNAFP